MRQDRICQIVILAASAVRRPVSLPGGGPLFVQGSGVERAPSMQVGHVARRSSAAQPKPRGAVQAVPSIQRHLVQRVRVARG